jgi:hypothetical protein
MVTENSQKPVFRLNQKDKTAAFYDVVRHVRVTASAEYVRAMAKLRIASK